MDSALRLLEILKRLYGQAVDPALADVDPGSIQRMIDQLEGSLRAAPQSAPGDTAHRWEDAVIESCLREGESVLDLGCGEGELLRRLMDNTKAMVQGIELDPESVAASVRRGVPVIQADLDAGLRGIRDNCFDTVILEETLQTVHRPIELLEEMLRVGRRGIVSFPNFGYWRVRLDLSARGQMPVTTRLPYQWYNSPNIHLFTIRDFMNWAETSQVRIVSAYVLAENDVRPLQEGDNLYAAEALFVVKKDKSG